jgi:2-polyprenyl-3-methyl-5-hydroxy-6-metoxy-1,4-benzoquinol methylase
MNWAEARYIDSRLRTRRLRRSVVPKLIELGGGTKGLVVLDVGCGPGECVACELDMFGAERVTAIDLDPKMVARAQSRLARYDGRASVGTGDVTDLRFPAGHFDAVFNFAVLHHVPYSVIHRTDSPMPSSSTSFPSSSLRCSVSTTNPVSCS